MALHQDTEGIDDSGLGSAEAIETAEAALRFAQRRDLILGQAFANPPWDIMLRLYAAALGGRDLPVSSLTDGSETSKVIERWLDFLVQDGLVLTALANGVPVVELTAQGKASMDALFASARAGTAVS